MMEEIKFKELEDLLKIGHEIEFDFNNKKYSITNDKSGFWNLYCDTDKKLLKTLGELENRENVVRIVRGFVIDGFTIEEIFNDLSYDEETLSIF